MQRTVLAFCLTVAFTNLYVDATVVGQAPAKTIQPLLAEARAEQARGDFAAAADSYRKAVALEPSVPELWANLGLMQHEAGKHDEAIRSFKEAIKLKSSLFVPQLFLGLEYLESKNPAAAIPFLEIAEKLNPDDLQAALNLGKAYTLLEHADRAADAYSIATRLAPNDGNAWLSLGMAYLQQVESDARLMTSTYPHSAYVSLRTAEAFAEEGKLVQSETSFKSAIASALPAPCTHAEFGIVLLRKKNVPEAREQFELEMKTETHCELAALGLAVAQLTEGHPDVAFTKLIALATADPGFVESNLQLFRDAVSADQAKSLIDLVGAQPKDNLASAAIGSTVENVFVSEDAPAQQEFSNVASSSNDRAQVQGNSKKLDSSGQYARCNDLLKSAFGTMASDQLQLLASCSFFTGDFRTASAAAQRLKTNPTTRAQGLYWECKADQRLAIAALDHAGTIDADSPRMHVLLGDIFRQKRRWDDAESEYRKAVALDPKSYTARLSLGIVLFTELKNDEAFNIDRALLAEDPNDAEANLLAAEILAQQNQFREAEPYLSKCQTLKPEFVPRLHSLLGQIYAQTDRVPAAISEYKAGLSADEDGSIHYQLARLYQKSGDRTDAEEAFRASKRLRSQWDDRASIALQQNSTDLSHH